MEKQLPGIIFKCIYVTAYVLYGLLDWGKKIWRNKKRCPGDDQLLVVGAGQHVVAGQWTEKEGTFPKVEATGCLRAS